MKDTLRPGIQYQHRWVLPASKMVPALYPEAQEFHAMPEVFATGFLVGFLEWACIRAINAHLDWPKEQSVGTHIRVTHEAATPVGFEVTASVELIAVEGKKLTFAVSAHDGVDLISSGTHERVVIDRQRFVDKTSAKAAAHVMPQASSPNPVPAAHRAATPYLIVSSAADAIAFYAQAFGALELVRLADPSGKVMHAELKIDDTRVMLADEFPDMGYVSPLTLGGSPVLAAALRRRRRLTLRPRLGRGRQDDAAGCRSVRRRSPRHTHRSFRPCLAVGKQTRGYLAATDAAALPNDDRIGPILSHHA